MTESKDIESFLSQYSEQVFDNAIEPRGLILKTLPGVLERIDKPARMIAYAYGRKYIEMVCTLIPSKKGLKLGFTKEQIYPILKNY